MARQFPLAGLLRVRRLQEEQAAGGLAEANRRLRDADDARTEAYAALHDLPADAVDRATLTAIAAARASARSMLAELGAVEEARRAEADAAQAQYRAARERAAVLGKLEDRHAGLAAAEELRAEQVVLDELAGSRHNRAEG